MKSKRVKTFLKNQWDKIKKVNLDLGRCGLCSGLGMIYHASAPDLKSTVCPSCKGLGRK